MGAKGLRIISAAWAEVQLRQMGKVRPRKPERTPEQIMAAHGNRPGKPWLDWEIKEVKRRRAAGQTKQEIAKAMKRTERSIDRKCGYHPKWGTKYAHAKSISRTKPVQLWRSWPSDTDEHERA
jgi:hypothetical protein